MKWEIDDLYYVVWKDASFDAGSWIIRENVNLPLARPKTVGFLIHEDKDTIVLAQTINESYSEMIYSTLSQLVAIPKVCIEKVVRLDIIDG